MPLPRSLRAAVVALLALGTPLLAACSLSLNQDKDQCKRDADCEKLGAALVCRAGLCVADAASGGSGGVAGGRNDAGAGGSAGLGDPGGAGGGGAAGESGAGGTAGASGLGGGSGASGTGGGSGASGTGGAAGTGGGGGSDACAVPAPTCPDNLCVPFDNCARLGLCAGATLPPLVAPPKP